MINTKNKEEVLKGLIAASSKNDGSLRMDVEELEDMADYIMSEDSIDVDPTSGMIRIKKPFPRRSNETNKKKAKEIEDL